MSSGELDVLYVSGDRERIGLVTDGFGLGSGLSAAQRWNCDVSSVERRCHC